MSEEFPDSLSPYRERLLEAERLASIGQLAAGVAHEINNPVGYLQSNLRALDEYFAALRELIQEYEGLLRAHLPTEQQGRVEALRRELDADYMLADLGSLLEESRQGVSIIRDIALALRDFARTPDGRMETVQLDDLVRAALRIAHNEVKYVARLDIDLQGGVRLVCDASMVSQVVLNLVVNASHAVEADGHIVVRTGRGDDEAWLEVEDNGCGIPPADIERIFDPFFTTKPAGRGTGLGLAMIRETVNRHGGRIAVDSEPGRAAVSALRFRCGRRPLMRLLQPCEGYPMRDLMLVDDEPLVLRSLERSFRRKDDCTVETYTDPEEALIRLQTKTFDVIISDYRMPGMTGTEFLRAARELQPRAVRLILSGQADQQALVHAINEAHIFRFLDKPWDQATLDAALVDAYAERDRLMEESVLAGRYRREQGL